MDLDVRLEFCDFMEYLKRRPLQFNGTRAYYGDVFKVPH